MKPDIRSKNEPIAGVNLSEFSQSYFAAMQKAFGSVDSRQLELAAQAIEKAAQAKRQIFTAGNGGSASISLHLCCDWTKGTSHAQFPSLRTHSLVANVSTLTALGNDFGFEDIFSEQLEYQAQDGDLLILVSSSGNSPNIVRALEVAQKLSVTVIGLSGFSGGILRKQSNIALHVDAHNFGIVEDCHQSMMHILAQWIAKLRDGSGK